MTLRLFKELRTSVKSFEKLTNFNGNLYGVIINGTEHRSRKRASCLTSKQLEYFEYIPDFENKSTSLDI